MVHRQIVLIILIISFDILKTLSLSDFSRSSFRPSLRSHLVVSITKYFFPPYSPLKFSTKLDDTLRITHCSTRCHFFISSPFSDFFPLSPRHSSWSFHPSLSLFADLSIREPSEIIHHRVFPAFMCLLIAQKTCPPSGLTH